MQFCKAPVFAVCTSRFPPHSPSWIMIAALEFSLPFSSCSLSVIFRFSKLLGRKTVVFRINFRNRRPGETGGKRKRKRGKGPGENGERMGNRTAGKGRERKEDRGKGKSMAKEQEWERKQGGGQTGRKEAPVFLRNFSCEPLRQRGVRGESPHGSPDFFRKFFRQLSAPLLRPEFCSRWERTDRK